ASGEGQLLPGKGCEAGKRLGLLPIIQIFARRDGGLLTAWLVIANQDKLVCLTKRQSAQQGRFDKAEDRGIGSNAKRQRHDRYGRKDRLGPQGSRGEPQI